MNVVPAIQYRSPNGKWYVLSELDLQTEQCKWSTDDRNNVISDWLDNNMYTDLDYDIWCLWASNVRDTLVAQGRFDNNQLVIVDVAR